MKEKRFSSHLINGSEERARRAWFVKAAQSVGVVAADVAAIVDRLIALSDTLPNRESVLAEAAEYVAAGKTVPDRVGARLALIDARASVLERAENHLMGELRAAVSRNTDAIVKELDDRLDSARDLISRCAADHRWTPGQPLGEIALISGDLAAMTVRLPDAIKEAEAVEKVRANLFGGLRERSERRLPQGTLPHPLLLPTNLADRDPSEPLGLNSTLSIESVISGYREGSAVLRVPTPADLDKAVEDICEALDKRSAWAADKQAIRGGMRLLGGGR